MRRAVGRLFLLHTVLLLPDLYASSEMHLQFKGDGSLKVVQLTDLHMGESSSRDMQTREAVSRILDAEADADLVVLSGDMISGFANRYSQQGWFNQKYQPLMDELSARNLKHAIVLGNHDDEGRLSREDIVRLDRNSPGSLTRAGPEHITGATNYWIDLADSARIRARLWFLDSMDRGCAGMTGWGCVAPDAVQWFRQTAARLPAVPTAAAFVHIPVPEFINAWNRGSNVQGRKGESVCCPSCNSGLFDALREHGIDAIYSGHDHNNDFTAVWQGVRLSYGLKSGYGSYGPSGQRGARVIVFRIDEPAMRSDTYIRLEDGTAYTQSAAFRPPWKRLQWSCEPGQSLRRIMFGAEPAKKRDNTTVSIGMFGACAAHVAGG